MHLEHEALRQAAEATPPVVAHAIPVPTPVMVDRMVPVPIPVEMPAPTPTDPAGRFAFVVQLDGPHVVLSTDPQIDWGEGRPRRVEHEYMQLMRQAVDADLLPPTLAHLATQSWDLYGEKGRRCSVSLGTPSIVAEIEGEVEWGIGPDDDKISPDQEIWNNGRRLLVAPVVGECATDEVRAQVWARLAELPQVQPWKSARANGEPAKVARTEFMRSGPARDVARTRREMTASGATISPLSSGLTATAWTAPGASEIGVVTLRLDGPDFGGCGGLTPLSGIVGLDDLAVRQLVVEEYTFVESVFDLDGDGHPEVLTTYEWDSHHVISLRPEGWAAIASIDPVPFYGCPC
jgi:hypothetical protein